MSASSSPGRSWRRVRAERRVRARAPGASAVVRLGGRPRARVPGLARLEAPGAAPDSNGSRDSMVERCPQRALVLGVGSSVAALPLIGLCAVLLVLAAACSQADSSISTPRVARVFAHVRGGTRAFGARTLEG